MHMHIRSIVDSLHMHIVGILAVSLGFPAMLCTAHLCQRYGSVVAHPWRAYGSRVVRVWLG